jgi:hypothetical protein
LQAWTLTTSQGELALQEADWRLCSGGVRGIIWEFINVSVDVSVVDVLSSQLDKKLACVSFVILVLELSSSSVVIGSAEVEQFDLKTVSKVTFQRPPQLALLGATCALSV